MRASRSACAPCFSLLSSRRTRRRLGNGELGGVLGPGNMSERSVASASARASLLPAGRHIRDTDGGIARFIRADDETHGGGRDSTRRGASRRLEDSVEARGRYYRGGAGKQLRRHSAFLGLDKTLSRRIPRPAVPHRGSSSGAHGYVGYGRYFRADSPGRRSARHASRRAFVASSAPRAEKRHARPRVERGAARRTPATASRVAVRRAASPLAARRSETSRGALADPSSRLPRLRRASSRRARRPATAAAARRRRRRHPLRARCSTRTPWTIPSCARR